MSIERLHARIAWLEAAVQQRAGEAIMANDRIEALEAALRRIRDDGKNCADYCRRQADKALRTSTRAALDKDTGK